MCILKTLLILSTVNKKKIIAVFTGNRAEYGLQFPVLQAIAKHADLDYRLIVSGAHLEQDFGNTLVEIQNDGFKIAKAIKVNLYENTYYAVANAIGTGVIEIGKALRDLQPDCLVVYADRFEGFAAIIAGTQMNIPTAHIEGGDLTEGGALDDSVRHAMTKLAHLHFTTNEQSTARILKMGEELWRIHTVGLPIIDLIKNKQYASKTTIIDKFHLNKAQPVIIFTQHSVATEFEQAVVQIRTSIKALCSLANKNNCQIIITYPNNDLGGKAIIAELENFKKILPPGIQIHESLGRYLYHGILALASNMHIVCVGNSSSGIKETPAFGCPAVNIGTRQNGRLRGNNVLDCTYDYHAIVDKVSTCLYDTKFLEQCRNCNNPYYLGGAGVKIANLLASTNFNADLTKKKMTY